LHKALVEDEGFAASIDTDGKCVEERILKSVKSAFLSDLRDALKRSFAHEDFSRRIRVHSEPELLKIRLLESRILPWNQPHPCFARIQLA
jgi:hypothetical protein